MTAKDIESTRKAIKDAGHSWQAGETMLSKLPIEQKKRYLGLIPPSKNEMARNLSLEREYRVARSVPAQFDWRSKGAVTPIKDQGQCGSCVAFGTLATVESCLKITKKTQNDLSEAYLFKLGGGKCDSGWTFKPALQFCQRTGVPDEPCCPYQLPAKFVTPCSDAAKRCIKIAGWQQIPGSAVKSWISSTGPVITGMEVYDDFFDYHSGVYHHVTGGLAGGHCVAIIGYDNKLGCWICKNSWGVNWGEAGFFHIGYQEAIGAAYGFFGVRV